MDKKDKIYKQFDLEVKATNKEKREVTILGSVQQVDRDGDIVDIKTMQLKNFKNNPVVLWSHRSSELPIAKVLSVSKASGNTQLKFKLQFPEKEVYDFSDQVYKLIKAGYINASSIGFKVDWEKAERISDKKRNGYNFNNTELLEISLVNVPANQGALITQRQFKDFCSDDKEFNKFKDEFIEEDTNDTTENSEQTLNDIMDRLNSIELSLNELTTKNVKEETLETYIDDLFSTIVDGSDFKSNDSSKTTGTIDDSDLDEILN